MICIAATVTPRIYSSDKYNRAGTHQKLTA